MTKYAGYRTSVRPLHFTLIGRPTGGKTVCAFSASQFFPKPDENGCISRQPKRHNLEDLVVWPFDKGATVGLQALNIFAPEVLWDEIRADEPNWIKAWNIGKDVFFDMLDKRGKDAVGIIDSATAIDAAVMSFYTANVPPTHSGKEDGFWIQRVVKAFHERLVDNILDSPFTLIANLHGVHISGDAADVRNRSSQPAGEFADVRPAFYFNAVVDTWRRSWDGMYIAHSEPYKGGWKRCIYTRNKNSIETKNRFQDVLEAEEPPHMYAILKKLRAAMGEDESPGKTQTKPSGAKGKTK